MTYTHSTYTHSHPCLLHHLRQEDASSLRTLSVHHFIKICYNEPSDERMFPINPYTGALLSKSSTFVHLLTLLGSIYYK